MNKYLTDYLLQNAQQLPEKPAIIFNDQSISWRQLGKAVEIGASYIASKLSNSEQHIVGIHLPNGPEFVTAYLSIVHSGHIAMPLDPNFKQPEISSVTSQMKPTFTITDANSKSYFTTPTIDVQELKNQAQSDAPLLRIDPNLQYVSMLFTSGTTGNPKATPYSHANHLWNIQAVSDLWQWTSQDTLLVSLALSHWHGLCVALTGSLVHGNTMYVHERFDPELTLRTLETGNISLCMHVPIAYAKLIEHNPSHRYDMSKVRLFISGSSYLPPAMWQKFKDRFGHEILERYGASEMGFLTSNLLDSRIPGCVGKPLEGVTIKIQSNGEIAMHSPGLFNGYWNNETATKEHRTIDGLWLSGDIGEFDEDGKIHLKGRVQEKMKKLGYTVYPRDVEWAIMQNPAITDTVVMSVQSDTQLSDEFVYFIVGSVTEEEVFAFAKTNLPNYWRPDTVILLDSIPRTGRASKPALKELRAMIDTHKK